MVVVAEEDRADHGGTTSRNGQTGHYRVAAHHRRQKTEDNVRPLQWMYVEVTPTTLGHHGC